MPLKAIALNCTLKAGREPSSTDAMLGEVLAALGAHDVTGEIVRVANLNIKPGVTSDEGEGDDWPELRAKIIATDILILGTPVWLGKPSSLAQRVMERMDAFLDETDDRGRMPGFGKVALAVVVGNEDGAHNCHAGIFQALNDVGFTVPAIGGTYWVGEAMGETDFKDLDETPQVVADTNRMLAANAAHLARLLKGNPYPGVEGGGGGM